MGNRELHPHNLDEYVRLFEGHGETDRDYLVRHHRRFLATRAALLKGWSPERGARMLDIGAHWLHQSVLFAVAGFKVTATEFVSILEQDGVRSLADAHGITLLPCDSLAEPAAFGRVPDDSFDLVLLCEVLEHLAFNPTALWMEIHRILRPGGRVVLTTPNYYYWKSRARGLIRLLTGMGAGVPVKDVLGKPTLAHHWKEYSARELRECFRLLSPDFEVRRIVALWTPARFFRPLAETLYAEVDLPKKKAGVSVRQSW